MDQAWTVIGLMLLFLMSGLTCLSLGAAAYTLHRLTKQMESTVAKVDMRAEAQRLRELAAAHLELQRGHVKMTQTLIASVTNLERAVSGFKGVMFPDAEPGVTQPDPKMANIHDLAERLQKLGIPRRDAEETAAARLYAKDEDEDLSLEFS